jgi:hypothetical protein
MIVKNKTTVADRAFWAHCEAVAREVSLWPKWMRGEGEIAVRSESKETEHVDNQANQADS